MFYTAEKYFIPPRKILYTADKCSMPPKNILYRRKMFSRSGGAIHSGWCYAYGPAIKAVRKRIECKSNAKKPNANQPNSNRIRIGSWTPNRIRIPTESESTESESRPNPNPNLPNPNRNLAKPNPKPNPDFRKSDKVTKKYRKIDI